MGRSRHSACAAERPLKQNRIWRPIGATQLQSGTLGCGCPTAPTEAEIDDLDSSGTEASGRLPARPPPGVG